MHRTLRNMTAVLVITLFTALAVFATVQLTGRLIGPADTAAAQTSAVQTSAAQTTTSGGQLVCPSTGCTASSCHATQ
jgi:hypothetical protein